MKTKYLVGRRVTLGLISLRADLSHYADWVNDRETTQFMAVGRFPVTLGELRAYVRQYAVDKTGLLLGIFLNKSKRHIGNITLNDIQWKDRRAEVGVLIGEKPFRGKGYGREAIELIVEHAFGWLNLHKLSCGMVEGNEASRRAFMRIGFKEEGFLRRHVFVDGSYLGCYRLGLLREEYAKTLQPKLKRRE
ncbi:MAG: GNAT family N-acetyltransferase [Elusimicrobia bacterium]|nr:GNAT family N-acetyltransferase [Elusimicrobiota bacterium]